MNKQEQYLAKLHTELLEIMDVVHNLCEKNDIKYFLIGGTLLGAIRHGGYIPWDDDLDIALPRDDYERFLGVAEKELPDFYQLFTPYNDTSYNQPYAKVVKKNTLFQETMNGRMGIFIDIFPYDLSLGNVIKLKWIKNLFRILCDVPDRHSNSIPFTIKYLPSHFLGLFMKRQTALIKADNLAKKTSKRGGTYYSNFSSGYSIIRETYPIEWFGHCKLMKFEDKMYYVPENPGGVLEVVFGKNYMQLPPENMRKTHCPLKVIFSDGEEMTFDSPSIKVSHKDVESFADYK